MATTVKKNLTISASLPSNRGEDDDVDYEIHNDDDEGGDDNHHEDD